MSTALAARIAGRETRRRPWRSLLVVALVAMPVTGMTVATSLIRTENRTPLEEWQASYGDADLVGFLGAAGPGRDPAGVQAIVDQSAPDAATLAQAAGYRGVRDDQHRAWAEILATDVSNPIHAGRHRIVEGRAPTTPTEVAVNGAMAGRFGLTVGAPFHLERPRITSTVVGIIDDRECVRCQRMYTTSEGLDRFGGSFGEVQVLVDLGTDLTAEELLPYQEGSLSEIVGVSLRPVPGLAFGEDGGGSAIRWSIVVGALVLAVVGIVIAAAFAVGARRQLVVLGQLSANGAPESVLRRVLVLQGTMTGAAGSAVGIAIGLIGPTALQGRVETYLGWRFSSFDRRLSDLLVIVLVGVVGATLAALVPAMTAARIPALHALAGRRPVPPVRRSLTVGGMVAMACGLGILAVATVGGGNGTSGDLWASVAVLGGLGVLFGATCLTPAMVQRLEPVAGRARGALRLAARSLARNRTRTGAVVAAVAAAGALAIGGTAAARAQEGTDTTRLADGVIALSEQTYRAGAESVDPDEAHAALTQVAEKVSSAVPDATVYRPELLVGQFEVGGRSGDPFVDYQFAGDRALVVDDELARAIGLSAGVRRALRDDGAIVIDYDAGETHRVSISFAGLEPVEADLRFSQESLGQLASGVYVTPDLAATLPLEPGASPVVVVDPDGFSEVELFDLEELYDDRFVDETVAAALVGTVVEIGRPDTGLDQRRLELILAAVSVLFALIVVGIGLALAAADERDEREILTVAGAGPGVLTKVSGSKAWILATLGFALAVPVGFLPAATVIEAGPGERALYFPVPVVLALVVVAPVVAAAIAVTVSSIARRTWPVRVSTATFE